MMYFYHERDGFEAAEMGEIDPAQLQKMIFRLDRKKVLGSRILIAVLDGITPDNGVGVEIGLAYEDKYHEHANPVSASRILVGLKTDPRAFLPGCEINPMISGGLEHITRSTDELITLLGPLCIEQEWYRDRQYARSFRI